MPTAVVTTAVASVICAGHVNWDVTLRVDNLPDPDGEATITNQFQSSGGSAANVARALAGLEAEPTLLGSLGDDEEGRLVRRTLAADGVDCAPVVTADGETTVKYLVVDAAGEVMVLGRQGANEAFMAADLPATTLAAAGHLHLTSQPPETAVALAERAQDRGLTVSLDPGRRVAERDYGPAVEHADYLFLNEREAQVALETYFGPETGLGCTAVLKHGDSGAEVLTADRTYTRHDGFPVEAVDTTGAGDAFAAGFLTVVLDGPPDFERALAVANACGALAARERGPGARPTWAAVDDLLG